MLNVDMVNLASQLKVSDVPHHFQIYTYSMCYRECAGKSYSTLASQITF